MEYELSFLGEDDSVLFRTKNTSCIFDKMLLTETPYQMMENKTGMEETSAFLSSDIYIVRCRIWNGSAVNIDAEMFFAQTLIGIETFQFFRKIKTFGNGSFHSSITPRQILPLTEINAMALIDTYTTQEANNENVVIIIYPMNGDFRVRTCIVHLVDIEGNLIKYAEADFRYFHSPINRIKMILVFPRNSLLENRAKYLRNDVLTLRCQFTVPSGCNVEEIKADQ
ncbi:hypothetical protein CEXT_295701 [Caerostris extrusa]|uniref:Uncharacterized protein n=1 Tax=Caerostris extrusa TaxID=172846 RepID=A0AAV4M865_CAEEX|nr:hypothetical protein CEXT_295701 [Caerostris extrusa]